MLNVNDLCQSVGESPDRRGGKKEMDAILIRIGLPTPSNSMCNKARMWGDLNYITVFGRVNYRLGDYLAFCLSHAQPAGALNRGPKRRAERT